MAMPPNTSYDDLLGDGLQAVLGQGAETLAEIVKGLNEINVHGPNGESWTEGLLAAELKRLGE